MVVGIGGVDSSICKSPCHKWSAAPPYITLQQLWQADGQSLLCMRLKRSGARGGETLVLLNYASGLPDDACEQQDDAPPRLRCVGIPKFELHSCFASAAAPGSWQLHPGRDTYPKFDLNLGGGGAQDRG